MKDFILTSTHTILFVITFYFTILRFITLTTLFKLHIYSLSEETNYEGFIFIILDWLMWFYQIWFWFTYFNII